MKNWHKFMDGDVLGQFHLIDVKEVIGIKSRDETSCLLRLKNGDLVPVMHSIEEVEEIVKKCLCSSWF